MTATVTLACVIASYDRPAAVQRAVKSVLLSNSFSEVIVVDDASPSPVELPEVRNGRLRILRHRENRGVCAARNTGTAATRASHVVYLDDDDALFPWAGWLYRRWIRRAAKRDPDSIVAGGLFVEASGRKGHFRRPPSSRRGEIWGLDQHLVGEGRSINTKQSAAIPKALVERVGGWDEALRSRSSSEMFFRLSEVARVEGHGFPVYRLNRGRHEKLTADPARRAESHAYIREKHARLLADPDRRAAFESAHEAMMKRTERNSRRAEAGA